MLHAEECYFGLLLADQKSERMTVSIFASKLLNLF